MQRYCWLLVLAGWLSAPAASEGFELEKIVAEGDVAPNTGGRTFERFGPAALNDSGAVSFSANLCCSGDANAADSGLWLHRDGENLEVVRENDPAPGFPAGAELSYSRGAVHRLNNLNRMVFPADVHNLPDGFAPQGFTSVPALWFAEDHQSPPAAVASWSMPAVGAGDGYVFGSIVSAPELNNSDQVAFSATVQNSDGSVGYETGIWASDQGVLRNVAITQGPAPGGAVFDEFRPPLLNDSGQIAFSAYTRDASLLGAGIWLDEPAGLSRLVATGDPAPGAGPDATFGWSVPYGPFTQLQLNERGEVGFLSAISGADPFDPTTGFWIASSSGLEAIAVRGQAAPGGEGWFTAFDDIRLSDSSDTLFTAFLADDPNASFGEMSLWRRAVGGDPEMLARVDEPVPGMPDNLVLDPSDLSFSYALAPNGDAIVAGRLISYSGPIQRSWVIWRVGQSGESEVLFDGDLSDFVGAAAAGAYTSITDLSVGEMNDAGQFIVSASLYSPAVGRSVDSYYLATLSSVPEPAGLAWLALGGWALGRRRRQPCC